MFLRLFFHALQRIDQEQRDLVTVKAFEGNCESGVLTQQVPILLARKKREAFYSVQFQKDKREKTSRFLWFFVFADGQFRYLGTIRIDAPMHWQQSAGSPGERVLVGGDLQKSKLLTQIHPKYPPIARDNGVQGTVRFNALIGTDGRLRNLQLVAGNCYLAEEAARTVRQWQYSPTLLQGKPVEVITTIDVGNPANRVHPRRDAAEASRGARRSSTRGRGSRRRPRRPRVPPA